MEFLNGYEEFYPHTKSQISDEQTLAYNFFLIQLQNYIVLVNVYF